MPKNINTISQSDFSLFPGIGYPGQMADGSVQNPISSILEGDGIVSFGDAVCGGTGDYQCKPFDGSNPYFNGIRFRNFGRTGVSIGSQGSNVPEEGDTLLLVDFGVIYVTASNSIKAGDRATLTASNQWAGGNVDGNYALDGAVFLTSGAKDSIVKLKMTGGKRLTLIGDEPVVIPTLTSFDIDGDIASPVIGDVINITVSNIKPTSAVADVTLLTDKPAIATVSGMKITVVTAGEFVITATDAATSITSDLTLTSTASRNAKKPAKNKEELKNA